MGRNKHKHRQQQLANQLTAVPTAASARTTSVPPPIITTADAVAAIEVGHEALAKDAPEADIEQAINTPAASDSPNIIQGAQRLHEALILLQAKEGRVAAREEHVLNREQAAQQREQDATKVEDQAKTKCRALDARENELNEQQKALMKKEKDLLIREANAEAGFLKEQRDALSGLEREAAALRAQISDARQAIIDEESNWTVRRNAAEEQHRKELAQAQESFTNAMANKETALLGEQQALREQLAHDRSNLKRDIQRFEIDRELLTEDRGAFNARVQQKAAALVEQAEAEKKELQDRLNAARAERDRLDALLQARESAETRIGSRSHVDVNNELEALRKECSSLKQQLLTRPGVDAINRLQDLERERDTWESERARLTQQVAALQQTQSRAVLAVTELETLRDQKAALESGKNLLHEALEELRKDVDERIRRTDGTSPFPECSKMDRDTALQTRPQVRNEPLDLRVFCDAVRHRMAQPFETGVQLYYSLSDVRCFLGGLAMSRLHLLQGISGTGKTSLPIAFARAIGAGCALIPVQAGWRDRQDLIGHFNAFERRFYESEFLKAIYEAQCPRYADLPYIVILDEMNLSHPEHYFADLISVLEQQDKHRHVLELMTAAVEPAPALLKDGHTIAVPPNVWFIGTANHDETTKDFADKTYDRAHVMELPRHRDEFLPKDLPALQPTDFSTLGRAYEQARKQFAKNATTAYRFLDDNFSELLGKRFQVGWGNRLERQMEAFVPVVIASGGEIGEAIDHILATKLLRKIRDRHDTRPEDLNILRTRVTESWNKLGALSKPAKSEMIIREELHRLGAEEEGV